MIIYREVTKSFIILRQYGLIIFVYFYKNTTTVLACMIWEMGYIIEIMIIKVKEVLLCTTALYNVDFNNKIIFKKHLIFNLLFLTTILGSYTSAFGQSRSNPKEISGYVTYNDSPLENVSVVVKNTDVKTTTNKKGYYKIKAAEKEIIQFSSVGMKPVEIIVEDVTKRLDITMVDELNELGEVVVKTNKKKNRYGEEEESTITTSYGKINKKSVSYGRIKKIRGKELTVQGTSLIETLSGIVKYLSIEKGRVRIVPNLSISSPEESLAIWDIDGTVYEYPPNLAVGDIDKVTVIKSVSGTTKYGMRGSGGVIVVRTIGAKTKKQKRSKKGRKKKGKQNSYGNGAVPYTAVESKTPYLAILDTVSGNKRIYKSYQGLSSNYSEAPSFYLDVSEYFKTVKNNDSLSLQVLSDAQDIFKKDPEALKAIAYAYQERGLYPKAVDVYAKLVELRPSYAQSYRDLANAYTENKQYKKAWNMYLQYLRKGNYILEEGIEKVVYSEMAYLYTLKKGAAGITENAEIKGLGLQNSKSDIRLVFEWNTSEAEFAIEFVDPQSRAFNFEHSQEKDGNRIKDEKQRGYSSNEFYLYDLTEGNWFINITYFGNKKNTPSYVKASVYRNWGKINQTKEVKLFKLKRQNYKMGLLKLNSKLSNSDY
ncbi:carboxypeptidase-like regulatory domain-containing protein [Aquimarina megaterium]|uniref:carboxypeptidase-like regulatory domain-containing protein n=1 Tax=Aquimarina megaterium TaxID=1443666 RepID=UPI0013635DA9|nr:carboxypeptidase-like regulatory domain-containing protein [Aquimarina megaterium]